MTTQLGTVAAPTTSDTIGTVEPEILHLDPDTAALIAEVDAILSAALTPARRRPAPPATGRALVGWSVVWCTGPPSARTSAPRLGRSTRPSGPTTTRDQVNYPT
jgi:hypothetical protein